MGPYYVGSAREASRIHKFLPVKQIQNKVTTSLSLFLDVIKQYGNPDTFKRKLE